MPAKSAALSKGLREMLISVDANETRVAVLEERALVEFYVERALRSMVGNIYLGSVKDVLSGMEAAFVDIGQKKNAFLQVDELVFSEAELSEHATKDIRRMLEPGQDVLVQVTKDPMGTKGARVTAQISLPGRFLVLMPFADFVGVSRRLTDSQREELHGVAEELKPKEGGLIVRTAAEDAGRDDIERDLDYLIRLWRKIRRQAKQGRAPVLLYEDLSLALRMVRDDFSARFQRLVIDDKATHAKVVAFLKGTSPKLVRRVSLHREKTPLFDKYGTSEQIQAALERRVWLKSGGYVTIDHTEALTAIDVNTGKYVGRTSLEDTALKTNLEAAAEIARQVRLRDIGGIIIIDFIDMEVLQNRQRVYEALLKALADDRTKTRVVEISQLGLVQMTRKNVTDGLWGVMTEECPTCKGTGRVVSDETLRIAVERLIMRVALTHRSQAFLFATDPKTLDLLLEPGRNRLAAVRQATGKFVSLLADPTCRHGEVKLVIEGKMQQIERCLSGGRWSFDSPMGA